MSRRRTSGLHRIREVRLLDVPTPAAVGLGSARPGALRPLARHYHEVPCSQCDSRCCTATVCINVVDLTRLVLLLRVQPDAMVDLDAEHVSALTIPAEVGGRSVHMILKQQPVEELERPACHMLARPGGELRCGVHGVRPGICRAYPFEFSTDRSDERFNVGLPQVCPLQWALRPAARRAIEQGILVWRRENDVAERIVRQWNHDHGGEDSLAFYRFVIERAARCLKLDSKPVLYQAPRRLSASKRLW